MGITQQSAAARLIQPGVCTSTTRPASPFEGQAIFETDTDRMLIWNGTAWVMPNKPTTNPDGLELVKTQTIGSAATNIPVSDAFSSTYDNYKIIVSGGVGSTVQLVGMYLGTSAPSSGYWSGRIINTANNGTPTGNGINNGGAWSYAGQASTNFINLNMDVINPFANKFTVYNGSFVLDNGGNSEFGTTTGMVNNTTSYTAFTLVPSANLTGGMISVYGYRK